MRRRDWETMKGNIGPGFLRIQRFFEGRKINGNAMKKAEAAEGDDRENKRECDTILGRNGIEDHLKDRGM